MLIKYRKATASKIAGTAYQKSRGNYEVQQKD